MIILVTGFEPFGGSAVNPSEQLAKKLAEMQPLPAHRVEMRILAVDRNQGPQALINALGEIHPEVVICLGEATGRAAISIERVAINLLDFRIPDNSGNQVIDAEIHPGGPTAYFSTLPVREMKAAIEAVQVPAELSLSAGSYLCNQVMYTLLDYQKNNNYVRMAGFIHLPALPEQIVGKREVPSMSLETAYRGLVAALSCLSEVSES